MSLEKFKNLSKRKFFVLFLFFVFLFNFGLAAPAKAQLVVSVANPITSIQDIGLGIAESIGGALDSGLSSALTFFINKLAYDAATWLASGDYTKGPAFITSAGSYFKDVGMQAAGEAIAGMSDSPQFASFLQKFGLGNLCMPPDLNMQLNIKLNLFAEIAPPTARCDFRQIMTAYKQVGTKDYWKNTGLSFSPGKNELSSFMEMGQAVDSIGFMEKEKARQDAELLGKAKANKEPVKGTATGPTATQDATAAASSPSVAAADSKKKAETTGQALLAGHWKAAGLSVANIFVSTLANKLMETLMSKGFTSLVGLIDMIPGGGGGGNIGEKLYSGQAQSTGARQAAEAAFADFLTVQTPELSQYTYLGDLLSKCSDNPNPFCGSLDSGMNTALSQAMTGKAMSVAEAMSASKNFLHGKWKLLPPGVPCEADAYCYDNLVKLRSFGILPIGWEAAAKLSSPDQPKTLEDAVALFYAPADISVNPFYHLIDPNWLLKAPLAKCGAQVFGKQRISEPTDTSPGQRGKYCADVQNCVSEKDQKTCEGWGYCLQEKNIWRLGGTSCERQFNTCTTYSDSNNNSANYLSSTIEPGICNADNVGCKAYSLTAGYDDNKNVWNWYFSGNVQLAYFNAKVEQCSAQDAGCTKLIRNTPGVEGEETYLKVAPGMFDCYGLQLSYTTNHRFFSSSTLDWPANKRDLQLLNLGSEAVKNVCKNYAQVCSAEENGCELYKSSNGRPAIPGILTANDLCPQQCAGYETYKEQPITRFSSSSISYFIPSTATECTPQYAGCEAFVNLEKQTQGGEAKEFYTDLRSCSKNPDDGQVYYTWEGSDTAGYQLKSYTLASIKTRSETNNYRSKFGDILNSGGTAGPIYNTSVVSSLNDFASKCSSSTYQNRLTAGVTLDADCREFYSQGGDKFYRLYSHTITVSPQDCQLLRLASADQAYCTATGGTWDSSANICTFLAIPREGKSCPAEMGGCRAYNGNAGNNFRTVYTQNFEGGQVGQDAQQLVGWTGKFSTEATVVGGKSLKANNTTSFSFSSEKGKTFLLYFWSKGDGSKLDATVTKTLSGGQITVLSQSFGLTKEWLPYSLGPITIDWPIDQYPTLTTTTITISIASDRPLFFVDNVIGQQMTDNIYVIKNSWQTPTACDNMIGDDSGESQGGSSANPYRLVPQAQLGCQNYTNRQNAQVAVRTFTNLCRPEAVGCEEFTDTFNTQATSTAYYNLSCVLAAKNGTNLPVPCQDKNGETLCSVSPRQTNCFFNHAGSLTLSTSGSYQRVVDLSDGTHDVRYDSNSFYYFADQKVYLVNDKKYQCSEENAGCLPASPAKYDLSGNGQRLASSTETVYLKANPEKFSQTLCLAEAEGCQAYTTNKGSQAYFKDPSVKNQFCEYKENVDLDDPNDDVPGRTGVVSGWFKKDVGVCGVKNAISLPASLKWCNNEEDCSGGFTCVGKGKMACKDLGTYGVYNRLPTRLDNDYVGFVGMCPAEQSGCSEFIDPKGAATVENPLGQPYYVIDNQNLDKSSCQGQVSLEKGCVLFNQTNAGSLIYSSKATYNDSQTKNYALVNTRNCGTVGTDASTKCNDSTAVNDSNVVLKVERDRVCSQWLACKTSRVFDNGKGKEVCVDMGVCDQYQNTQSLIGRCSHWVDNSEVAKRVRVDSPVAVPSLGSNEKNYRDRDVSFTGRDYTDYTWPDAYEINTLTADSEAKLIVAGKKTTSIFYDRDTVNIDSSCRGYPSGDVPILGSTSSSSSAALAEACSYTKVVYSNKGGSNKTVFAPFGASLGAGGVCLGGFTEKNESKDGMECYTSADCSDDRPKTPPAVTSEDGECLTTKKASNLSGWNGYCLFEDSTTKACAQWYPIATPPNSISIDDLNSTAGYLPPVGSGRYWCAQAKGNFALNSEYNSKAKAVNLFTIDQAGTQSFPYFVNTADVSEAYGYNGEAHNLDTNCTSQAQVVWNTCAAQCQAGDPGASCREAPYDDPSKSCNTRYREKESECAKARHWTYFEFKPTNYDLKAQDVRSVELLLNSVPGLYYSDTKGNSVSKNFWPYTHRARSTVEISGCQFPPGEIGCGNWGIWTGAVDVVALSKYLESNPPPTGDQGVQDKFTLDSPSSCHGGTWSGYDSAWNEFYIAKMEVNADGDPGSPYSPGTVDYPTFNTNECWWVDYQDRPNAARPQSYFVRGLNKMTNSSGETVSVMDFVWSGNDNSSGQIKSFDALDQGNCVDFNAIGMRLQFNDKGKLDSIKTKTCANMGGNCSQAKANAAYQKCLDAKNNKCPPLFTKRGKGEALSNDEKTQLQACDTIASTGCSNSSCSASDYSGGVGAVLKINQKTSVVASRVGQQLFRPSVWSELASSANSVEADYNISEIAALGLVYNGGATDKFKPNFNKMWPVPGSEILIYPNQALNGVKFPTGDNTDAYYWSGPLKVNSNGDLVMDAVWAVAKGSGKIDFSSSNFGSLNVAKCTDYKKATASARTNVLSFSAVFDKTTGQFKLIKTRDCSTSKENDDNTGTAEEEYDRKNADESKQSWDLRIYLREVCTDIRQLVTNDPKEPFGIKSKMRTDRIWPESNYKLGQNLAGTGSLLEMAQDQWNTPFGSFSRNGVPSTENLNVTLSEGKSDSEKIKFVLQKYGFWPIMAGGGGATPLNRFHEASIGRECIGGTRNLQSCGGPSDCPPRTWKDTLSGEEVKEYGFCNGSSLDENRDVPRTDVSSAYDRLTEIGVATYGTWVWVNNEFINYWRGLADSVGKSWSSQPCKFGTYCNTGKWYTNAWSSVDYSSGTSFPIPGNASASKKPRPPEVSSFNYQPNAVTINGNDGINPDPFENIVRVGNTSLITMQFYAWADDNQMPITRVAVDWGDGTPTNVTLGWFKNHKKICNVSTDKHDGTGTRVHFGDSPSACQEDFFTFKHIYDCPANNGLHLIGCNTTKTNTPCWDSGVGSCVFNPKVQVLDNWGWCNGTCTTSGLEPGTSGCWNDQRLANGELVRDDLRACYIGSNSPWTKFGGAIEIKP